MSFDIETEQLTGDVPAISRAAWDGIEVAAG